MLSRKEKKSKKKPTGVVSNFLYKGFMSENSDSQWIGLNAFLCADDYTPSESSMYTMKGNDAWHKRELVVRISQVVYFEHVKRTWYAHLHTTHDGMPALGAVSSGSVQYIRSLPVAMGPTVIKKPKNGTESKKRPRTNTNCPARTEEVAITQHKASTANQACDQDKWSDDSCNDPQQLHVGQK